VSSARPGSRAPHAWLERGGERLSTIDLFDGRFVLLSGEQSEVWVDAAARLAAAGRPELVAHMLAAAGNSAIPMGLGEPLMGWSRTARFSCGPTGMSAGAAAAAPMSPLAY
jgi:putative polyketide hydroxylase